MTTPLSVGVMKSNDRILPSYVLVTPVRNEEKHIEVTIESVLAQTVKPIEWVIVSDGSTDRTDEIVSRYAESIDWIRLFRRCETGQHSFSSKVCSFNVGLQNLGAKNYQYIGNIDGDISFDNHHFEFLLDRFSEDSSLGLAGALMVQKGYDVRRGSFFDDRDVFGACQFFRRECFEQIGGYQPIPGGGVDWLAVRMSRMRGWKTKTFMERTFLHHGVMGNRGRSGWYARFDYGRKDWSFGNSFLWESMRVLFQMRTKPYIIGGIVLGLGYLSAALSRAKSGIPEDVRRFHREDQHARLRCLLRSRIPLRWKAGKQ